MAVDGQHQDNVSELTHRARGLFPALLSISTIAAVISSLGVPLIPTIAEFNGTSVSTAQWSLTVTSLAAALSGPTMGRLADGPRRRAVILVALGAVLIGNVLSALPLDFAWFLTGRALQGIGLGLTPLTIAVARDCLRPDQVKSAVATLSVTTISGVGLGFPLVGVLAEQLGLHAAFWFAAALSLFALVAAALAIPSTASRAAHRFDTVGAVVLAVSLTALLLVISEAAAWGWTSLPLLLCATVGVVTMAIWVVHERRTTHPLVDLHSLRSRPVMMAAVITLLSGIANYMMLSVVARFVQTPASAGYGFDSTVIVAGLVLVPFSLMSFVGGRWMMPWIADRAGSHRVLPIAALVSAGAMLLFLLHREWLWEILLVTAIAGIGIGLTFAAIPGLIIGSVPPAETGSAMSFNQVLRQVGFAVGSGLGATLLTAFTPVGALLPIAVGYDATAIAGIVLWLVTAAAAITRKAA